MRTALIDKFRDMAHFEIVVAPVERFVSNVQQNHYLSRSVRRLGAERTLLVANKSDVSNSISPTIPLTSS
jgi:hypothetical protein